MNAQSLFLSLATFVTMWILAAAIEPLGISAAMLSPLATQLHVVSAVATEDRRAAPARRRRTPIKSGKILEFPRPFAAGRRTGS